MQRQQMRIFRYLLVLILFFIGVTGTVPRAAAQSNQSNHFEFQKLPGKIAIYSNKQLIATYVYKDPATTRPYFVNLKTLKGTQITRSHPLTPNEMQDHPLYHPGLFLAFGDINGNDYWRLKSKVLHDGFIKNPEKDSFTIRNRYLSPDDSSTVCTEICKYHFLKVENGYLINCESTFQSDKDDFYFGDQEEMGLGVRITLPLCEKGGNGRLLNSSGLTSAKKTWGQEANWSDYSGTIGSNQVGVMIMASPVNKSPTWWHNRDYGLMVANMFGRHAMQQGDKSKLVVKKGIPFRFGYSVYIHEGTELTNAELDQVYQKMVKRNQ